MTSPNTERFIKDAIEGGYPDPFPWTQSQVFARHRGMGLNTERKILYSYVLLDPLAWKAVGKVRGWYERKVYIGGSGPIPGWHYKMHKLVDALAEGKSAEEYFGTI